MSQRPQPDLIFIGLALFGLYVIFTNLDRSYLWQDEAETACVGRTILDHGIPKGHNELNSFSQQEGLELGSNDEWKLHPWFQFYWSALFSGITETSTFGARFPFALFGFASIILIYYVSLSLFKDKNSARFAVLFLSTNVLFLLLSRQVRYYPAVIFFILLCIFAYLKGNEKNKWNVFDFVYVGSSILLFSSYYFYGLSMWLSILIYCYYTNKNAIRKYLLMHILILSICLPYLFWMLDNPYVQQLSAQAIDYSQKFSNFTNIISFLHSQVFSILWIAALLVIIYFSIKNKNHKISDAIVKPYYLLIGFGLISVFILSLAVQEAYIRYLCGVIPVLALLAGRIMSVFTRVHITIAAALLLITLFSQNFHLYLIKELNTNYNGPIRGLVSYLKDKSEPGDRILIPYGDLPLKFYLPDRKFIGGHTEEKPKDGDNFDFMIARKNAIRSIDLELNNWIKKELKKGQYELFDLNYPDLPYENRENPYEHVWENPEVNSDNVLIISTIK